MVAAGASRVPGCSVPMSDQPCGSAHDVKKTRNRPKRRRRAWWCLVVGAWWLVLGGWCLVVGGWWWWWWCVCLLEISFSSPEDLTFLAAPRHEEIHLRQPGPFLQSLAGKRAPGQLSGWKTNQASATPALTGPLAIFRKGDFDRFSLA